MTFHAEAKNGQLSLGSEHNRSRFSDWLKTHEGARLVITEPKTTRTLTQNNFYWLYLSIISMETGDNDTDLHEYFKRHLLPPRFTTVMGKEIKLPATTTTLTKHEFSEYLDKICVLTEVPLPDPELAGFYTK